MRTRWPSPRFLLLTTITPAGRVSLHSSVLRTSDTVQMIYRNTKFTLVVRQTGPESFLVALPSQPAKVAQAELRALSNGGALILLDGTSGRGTMLTV